MEILEWIGGLALAHHLKRSALLYMAVNAAHILAIASLIGAILPLDLRILGLFRSFPLAVLGPFLSRAASVGVVAAVVTGLCLFTVRPVEYAGNPAFLCKIGLLAFGVLNALLLHASPDWRRAISLGVASFRVKLSAAISFFIWIGALVAGRWIGFL
jgi:predicted membrane-bound mannosyltransferase